MSKTAAINAVVNPAAKELPNVIKLDRAECVSINALTRDEQLINQKMQELNQQMNQMAAALKETQGARLEIVADIERANSLEAGTLAGYQYNGKELVRIVS
jgi:hypothetical protein